MAPVKALLIADDVQFVDFASHVLSNSRRLRIALESAGSIREGIAKLASKTYDLLILDCSTPIEADGQAQHPHRGGPDALRDS